MKWIFVAMLIANFNLHANDTLKRTYTVYTWTEEPTSQYKSGLPAIQMSVDAKSKPRFPVHPSFPSNSPFNVGSRINQNTLHQQVSNPNLALQQVHPQNWYHPTQTLDYYPNYNYFYNPQTTAQDGKPLHQIQKNRPSNSRVRRRNLLLFGGALNNTVGKQWKHRNKVNKALGGGAVANELLHLIKKNNIFK